MAKKRIFRCLLSLSPSFILGGALLFSRIDPRVHWLPALANPLVPGLLLSLFLLLIWQLSRRRYGHAALSLAMLFLAWPLVKQTFAWGSVSLATDEQSTAAFSIATANVYNFRAARQNNHFLDSAAIIDFVDRLSADVLLLQEYDFSLKNWRSKLISTHGQLAYSQKINRGSLMIFSRWPLRLVEEKALGNSVNAYQVVDIHHPEGIFRAINFHLKSNQITHIAEQLQTQKNSSSLQKKDQLLQMFSRYGRASAIRSEQAVLIAQLVSQSPYPVVLGGDMNDVPSATPHRLLLSKGRLKDTWLLAGKGIGATFAGNLPALRIDYILADTAFQVMDSKILSEGYADHRPLRAKLGFK